jgi:hypothetical protein
MRRKIPIHGFLINTGGTIAFFLLPFSFHSASPPYPVSAAQEPESKNSESVRAFAAMASVLTSPRCANCHIPGDSPLQGDESTPHNMNVKRGPDGRGTPAMRCANCHQNENSRTAHAPPGAPNWRLPTPSTPMAWQGLSTGELCRALRDPARNGGRSLPQLVDHFATERLVLWAWNPGPGRTLPPLSHDQFVERVKQWIATGAACAE